MLKSANHPYIRNFIRGMSLILGDNFAKLYFSIIIIIISLGLFGPMVAPYEHDEFVTDDQGRIDTFAPPSLENPLGTNANGQDIFSRLLVGARPTVISGLVAGTMIIGIGATIGITAGYVGGPLGSVLMRFTDFVYGIPFIPFALIVVGFLGIGFIESVIIIGLLLWRGNARVLRAQTLQIKQRPYVTAAKATGASTPRIIYKHILPNVTPMLVLFFSIGIGLGILLQAALAFIGVSDPFVPSWGVILRRAYESGHMSIAWWWPLSAGLAISLSVLSTFMFGRKYETLISAKDDRSAETMTATVA